jgi:hypothetical protein
VKKRKKIVGVQYRKCHEKSICSIEVDIQPQTPTHIVSGVWSVRDSFKGERTSLYLLTG